MPPRIKNLFLRCDLVLCKCRRSRHNLKRRTGRIFSRNRLVIHRMIGIVVEHIPVHGRDSARKEIRIERGTTHHREDLTCLGVHHDRRRSMGMDGGKLIVNRTLGCLLDVAVNCQYKVISRYRGLTSQNLHRASRDVHLNLLTAFDAAHFLVIDTLKTKFTDDIAGLIPLTLAALQLLLVDLADITEYMCSIFAENIVAYRQYLDNNTRITVFLLLDNGNYIGQDIVFNTNWIKTDMRINFLLNLLDRYMNQR